jgi:putative oxidoreductase
LALAQGEQARHAERNTVNTRNMYFYVAGRMVIGLLFVAAAIAKIASFDDTRIALNNVGLSAASFVLTGAILIELVSGILIGVGYRVRRAAAFLIAYLGAMTVLALAYAAVDVSLVLALINLAFTGGLLTLLAHGPGRFSLERWLKRRIALRGRP